MDDVIFSSSFFDSCDGIGNTKVFLSGAIYAGLMCSIETVTLFPFRITKVLWVRFMTK